MICCDGLLSIYIKKRRKKKKKESQKKLDLDNTVMLIPSIDFCHSPTGCTVDEKECRNIYFYI